MRYKCNNYYHLPNGSFLVGCWDNADDKMKWCRKSYSLAHHCLFKSGRCKTLRGEFKHLAPTPLFKGKTHFSWLEGGKNVKKRHTGASSKILDPSVLENGRIVFLFCGMFPLLLLGVSFTPVVSQSTVSPAIEYHREIWKHRLTVWHFKMGGKSTTNHKCGFDSNAGLWLADNKNAQESPKSIRNWLKLHGPFCSIMKTVQLCGFPP